MLLSSLAEGLATHLNDKSDQWRPADDSVEVENAFDPLMDQLDGLRIFVMPGQNLYQIETSPRRRTIKQHIVMPTVLLAIGKPFEEIPEAGEFGQANWDEAKELLNLQERLEEQAIYYKPSGLSLSAVEAIPPEDLNSDTRNFVVATNFVYERMGCESQHALVSPSNASSEGMQSVRTRGSIRSRALSAGRQERN